MAQLGFSEVISPQFLWSEIASLKLTYMGVSLNGGTPNSHPKMIIFSRKKPMGQLGKPTILGNSHIGSKSSGGWSRFCCGFLSGPKHLAFFFSGAKSALAVGFWGPVPFKTRQLF